MESKYVEDCYNESVDEINLLVRDYNYSKRRIDSYMKLCCLVKFFKYICCKAPKQLEMDRVIALNAKIVKEKRLLKEFVEDYEWVQSLKHEGASGPRDILVGVDDGQIVSYG